MLMKYGVTLKPQLMLEDHSDYFLRVVPDIAGAVLGLCTFGHNFEPFTCSCRLKFGHKGQHRCYDEKCPFTWIDESKVNPEVISFEEALFYCAIMEFKKQVVIASEDDKK